MSFLETRTDQRFRHDLRQVRQWVWAQPYDPHPDYALFKGVLVRPDRPGVPRVFPR